MIPLDSGRWLELRDAYGSAAGIPSILRAIAAGKATDEEWGELWSRTYHQGNIFEASYAIVPHLVNIARDPAQTRWDLLALPAAVEVARLRGAGPRVSSDLAE